MDHPAPQASSTDEPTGSREAGLHPATMPLISLDDGWAVLAVDEHTTDAGTSQDLYVYAVDIEQHGISSYRDLQALELRESAIPVRPFLLSELPAKHRDACVQTFGLTLSAGGL